MGSTCNWIWNSITGIFLSFISFFFLQITKKNSNDTLRFLFNVYFTMFRNQNKIRYWIVYSKKNTGKYKNNPAYYVINCMFHADTVKTHNRLNAWKAHRNLITPDSVKKIHNNIFKNRIGMKRHVLIVNFARDSICSFQCLYKNCAELACSLLYYFFNFIYNMIMRSYIYIS